MSQPNGSPTVSNEYRLALNNYLQNRFRSTACLSWAYERDGPDHAIQWTAIAYFNNIEYGRGTNHQKGAAAEVAAYQTLVALSTSTN
ncbi:hypothetical protein PILCRDRAFT_810757 [Piloderma croceum F 1598]|uniref:DRBM domain-containing protein n=1 Tax=Piloderma croceum (strain F 1598) TaxID=765440 RepID=A0A0C3BY56_PILCF|nr:hypothetical protein PILCRDRAFT_810757 [Piloderma croceum F 1598]